MYRFLDKRFYNTDVLTLDLVEFACGHVGLTEVENVALLKRRLAPGITELEKIGFLRPLSASERYQKVKAGAWKIVLHRGNAGDQAREQKSETIIEEKPAESTPRAESEQPTPEPKEQRLVARTEGSKPSPVSSPEAEALATEFYRLWNPAAPTMPGMRDREQAELLVKEHGVEDARAVLACLVQVVRKEWPDCRSLSGAAQKYLPDALKLHEQQKKREVARKQAEQKRLQGRQKTISRQEEERQRQTLWEALSEQERQAILQDVRVRLADTVVPDIFLHRLCLEEAARRAARV
jgi:hypothetical protein